MRIGPYAQVQQMYANSKPMKTASTQKKGFSDVVSISDAGKDFQIAKTAVAQAPDVRENVIDAIKAKLDAGTYNVSADDFADKLVDKIGQGFSL